MQEDYIEELKKRGRESRVYTPHQLVGLEIAEILEDNEHKALYMKLAKTMDHSELLGAAKSVAERGDVENKGAYFMKVIHGESGVK